MQTITGVFVWFWWKGLAFFEGEKSREMPDFGKKKSREMPDFRENKDNL